MSQSESRRSSRALAANPATSVADDAPAPTPEVPSSAAPLLPPPAPPAAKAPEDFGAEFLAAVADSQSALARGAEAVTGEIVALVRNSLALAATNATAILGARTFSDAVEANFGFARSSFDSALAGSARVAEIGVRTASDALRPLIARLGETWMLPRAA